MGGHAQVPQDTVDPVRAAQVQRGVQIPEIGLEQRDALPEVRQSQAAGLQGFVVLVKTDEAGSLRQTPGDLCRMSAAARRTIHINASPLGLQSLQNLGEHNRNMTELHPAPQNPMEAMTFSISGETGADCAASYFSGSQISQ